MTDLLLPPALGISRSSVRYVDNTGISTSPYGGPTLTSALGGDRLSMSAALTQEGGGSATSSRRRAQMMAFLARMRGRQNRWYAWDRGYRMRGGFPTGELVANPEFASGTTGWTTTATSSDLVVSAVDGVMRLQKASAAHSDYSVYTAAITVVSGAAYAARVAVTGGYGGTSIKILLGTTAGASDIAASSAISTDGVHTLVGIASGTTMYLTIVDFNSSMTTYRSTGAWQEIHYASLSRCLQVKGASQAGGLLLVDGFGSSLTDVLLAGDQVEVITSVGSELHILTASLQSLGSDGYLQFGPVMRGTPADNAAVIVYRPMSRWLFTGTAPEWSNEPGVFSSAQLDFVEAQ